MTSFETRTARAGMSPAEIKKFVGDFTEALVQLALTRIRCVDADVRAFDTRFDTIGVSLDWSDAERLAKAGIKILWLNGMSKPHRTYMHPKIVTAPSSWEFVAEYINISMVSDKFSRILFPNLVKRRRPSGIPEGDLLDEAKVLNRYLHLVHSAGFSGDRIIAYHGDLRTHGQGQNDSGRIGAVGATAAILAAILEISPNAVVSTYGIMPSASTTPAEIVLDMAKSGYIVPKALLLSSNRAIIFSSDPDVAIISRIGGDNPYASAEEAYDHWVGFRRRTAEERISNLHQAALGEVKTALDPSNIQERLALGSRETRSEAGAVRFLMMAVLTKDILDPNRTGRRALYGREVRRFQDVFNLYFVWGYDGTREEHPEHWADFKSAIKRWTGL